MSVEKGRNFIGKQEKGVPADFIIYSSGHYRKVCPGSTPRSIRRLDRKKPQGLEDGDFVISEKGLITPRMQEVSNANGGEAIQRVLQRILIEQGHTLRAAGKMLGVPNSTLHSWLEKFEIPDMKIAFF